MAGGVVLDNGTIGCPPTQSVPAGYDNHFFLSPGGGLALDECFNGLKYFGATRWDIPNQIKLDVLTDNAVIPSGVGTDLVVQNQTACNMGILIGLDMGIDIEGLGNNHIGIIMSARFNGSQVATVAASSTRVQDATLVRNLATASTNPQDPQFEAGGGVYTLTPGGNVTVSARLILNYRIGTPNTADTLFAATSAVRVYGYIL